MLMPEALKDVNIENLVFLDTMIWLDCIKTNEKQSALADWMRNRNNEILIHSNLAFELFNPRFSDEFDKIWDAIKSQSWSNFSPIALISEEFAYVLLGKPLNRLLENGVYHYGKREIDFYYHEYTTYGHHFYVDKPRKIAQENFLKISKQFEHNENLEIPFFQVLAKMKKMMSSNVTLDYSFFDSNIESFLKRDAVSDDVIKSTHEIVEELKLIKDNDFFNENIRKLDFMRKCGVRIDEKFTLGKFQEIDYLLEKAATAYSNGLLDDLSWREIAPIAVQLTMKDFPGLHLIQSVSNDIRKSNAKAKPSDQIDYLNLMYLPYVSLYVTDAHITNIVKQRAPQYSHKIISASDFTKSHLSI